MQLINSDKISRVSAANVIGHALVEIHADSIEVDFDMLTSAVAGVIDCDGVELDSIICDAISDNAVEVIKFCDFIGVDNRVISDMISDNDKVSADSISLIAKKFSEAVELDAVEDISLLFANEYNHDDVILDSMPPRKAGYKRQAVVRNGKKTFVNKRVSGKKVILSPAQKRGLLKARLKANSPAAKAKRARSMKKSKAYKI